MKREQLKELGLTDEQIEAVMKSHGETVNGLKTESETLKTKVSELEGDIAKRDEAIEELKNSADIEGLNATIESLQKELEADKAANEERLYNVLLDTALESYKPKTEKAKAAIKALLDKESIKLEGEKLEGLQEQLEALKESESYLFDADEPKKDDEQGQEKPPYFLSDKHQQQGTNDDDVFTASLEKYL